jgi:hypothetical protein
VVEVTDDEMSRLIDRAPNRWAKVPAAAPVRHAWPLVYSGYGGVGTNGVQAGSGSAGSSRMAVIGRQYASSYLARQHRISASPMLVFSNAKARAARTAS